MFDSEQYAACRAEVEYRRCASDAILIAETRRRVAAGLPVYEPRPDDRIQVGSYFLDPRTPPDVIKIVADQVKAEADIRLIRAARARIAAGTHSAATRAFIQSYTENEGGDDDPDPEPPEPTPRARPWEFATGMFNRLLPETDAMIAPAHEPETVRRMDKTVTVRLYNDAQQARIDALPPGRRTFEDIQKALRPPRPPLAGLVFARDMRPRLSAGGSLIKGLLDEAAMSVIYAPSNVGKSFLMLDIAYHIATGTEWRGLRIKKPGAVLYIASEGGYGFINRVIAIKRHYGLPDDANIPLAVLPCPVDLLDPTADRDAIIDLIDQVAVEFDRPVVLLVLDTLSRIMAGGDENGPKDMTAVVANIDNIRQRSNVHTAIVHHAGKDIAKGARGHSSLRAATDTEIELTRTGEGDDKTFTVAVKKQRELSGDETFLCNLKSVYLGDDEDGSAVTSAVVEHIAEHDPGATTQKVRQTANDIALSILSALIASQGQPLPSRDGYPAGLSGVTEELWRRECDSQRLSKAEADTSRDRAFRRTFDSLHMKHAIGTRDGMVWMLRHATS